MFFSKNVQLYLGFVIKDGLFTFLMQNMWQNIAGHIVSLWGMYFT